MAFRPSNQIDLDGLPIPVYITTSFQTLGYNEFYGNSYSLGHIIQTERWRGLKVTRTYTIDSNCVFEVRSYRYTPVGTYSTQYIRSNCERPPSYDPDYQPWLDDEQASFLSLGYCHDLAAISFAYPAGCSGFNVTIDTTYEVVDYDDNTIATLHGLTIWRCSNPDIQFQSLDWEDSNGVEWVGDKIFSINGHEYHVRSAAQPRVWNPNGTDPISGRSGIYDFDNTVGSYNTSIPTHFKAFFQIVSSQEPTFSDYEQALSEDQWFNSYRTVIQNKLDRFCKPQLNTSGSTLNAITSMGSTQFVWKVCAACFATTDYNSRGGSIKFMVYPCSRLYNVEYNLAYSDTGYDYGSVYNAAVFNHNINESDLPGWGGGDVMIGPGINTGTVEVYIPSESEMNAIAQWLWSTSVLDRLQKLTTDPMDCIVSFHALYLPSGTVQSSGSEHFIVGNVDSGVSSTYTVNTLLSVDCGSCAINEIHHNVLDYEPYTSFDIFLPYIGFKHLKADDIMGGTVHVLYCIDIVTGTAVAKVSVTKEYGGQSSTQTLYTYPANLAIQVPITGVRYGNVVTAGLGVATSVGAAIASGGAAIPVMGAVAAGTGAVVEMDKANVERSGAFSGNVGLLTSGSPYIIRTAPIDLQATNFNQYYGYPTSQLALISACSGFTRAKEVKLSGITNATKREIDEIETLLKMGIYV